MRAVYNIDFEVAGVAFLIIVAIFVKLRYTTGTKNNVIFRRFYSLLIAAESLDVITAVMISKANVIPPAVNMIANTLYMSCAALTESTLVRYICAFSSDEGALKIHKFIVKVITGFYFCMLAVNLFTNVVFGFVNGEYVHGPLYMVTFLIPLFFILQATYLIIFRRYLFNKNLIISTVILNVLTLAGILLQMLFWPYTLTTYFGVSLSALTMIFTLETPDFLKLQETMTELQKSNSELKHLQGNLRQEVDSRTAELRERQSQLQHMTFDTVRSLASAIDAKDEYTNGHSNRVSQYAVILAKALGWDDEAVQNLEMAAVLHDIGKIGVPDRILNKPGKLTEIEYELVCSHTLIGYAILENLPDITCARDVARSHHERYDGKGYPDGLKGTDIPEAARLVCIADAYDAMNTKRVYRNELKHEKIRSELVRGRGTQFDPEMVDVFIRLMDEGKLVQVEKSAEETVLRNVESLIPKSVGTDPLTGLLSRIPAEDAIRAEMERDSGCLAIIDIDRLREVNERFGHTSGDALLTDFAAILKEQTEQSVCCRVGGDEFLFYISGAPEKEAYDILDRLTEAFYAMKASNYVFQDTSLSIGAVYCHPGDRYEDVFSCADKALYHQKQSGRPGCYIYQETSFAKRQNMPTELDALVRGLEKNGDYSGILQLNYSEFARVYELIRNIADRYSCNYQLVMITLDSAEGENLYVENMDKAMECMQKAIMQVIRRVDICTRYSTVQYLVMLMRVDSNDAKGIVDRIFRGFYRIYGSDKVQPDYAIASVTPKISEEKKKERRENNDDL